jgi:23S rRNA (uridine2552-2'-O)-methyltransferase
MQILRPGGSCVLKVFHGSQLSSLVADCRAVFKYVDIVKPKSSRSESAEVFLVCRRFGSK